jgi:hypothetical protein
MSITNLPNEIVLELSRYLTLIDKISLLRTNSYIYQKKNEFLNDEFLNDEEKIKLTFYNNKLDNIDYFLPKYDKLIMKLICKYNCVSLLGKYLGSFKNTKIDKDDIYAVWDNDFYELFILLLRLNSWSVQIINVNLIFLEAAGLGLIDVVRALLGHDRLDIGYFNEFLQEAIENNHHEIISLLREEYSYLEEQRGEHRAI